MTKKTDTQAQPEKTLATVNELCKILGTYERKLGPAIEAAGLKPEYEAPFGTKMVRLYSIEKARAIMDALRAQDAEKAAAKDAAKTAAKTPPSTPPVDLNPALTAISHLHDRLDVVEELCKKTTEQNVLIFRALNDARAESAARIDAIQTALENLLSQQSMLATSLAQLTTPATSSAPVVRAESAQAAANSAAEPTEKAAAKKPRVVIVGLLNPQRSMIEKEFDNVFDLRFFNSKEGRGKSFAASAGNASAVFAMVSFIDHGVENVIKASGSNYLPVRGGLTALRDAMTALYVNQGEKLAA